MGSWNPTCECRHLDRERDVRLSAELDADAFFSSRDQIWLSSLDAEEATTSHGYEFWLEGRWRRRAEDEDCLSFCIRARPLDDCDKYSLLVDYRISCCPADEEEEKEAILIQFDLIGKDSHTSAGTELPFWLVVGRERSRYLVSLDVRVREVLAGKRENLLEESPYRDFALLAQDTAFYVNVNYMADLGSSYFSSMADSRRKGVKRTVLLHRSASELRVFFDALCTYRKPVVTCRNFEFVLQLASEFKVAKALRVCEQYLLESVCVHPIRKLEYAAEFGLGILGDTVIRSFGCGFQALRMLHDYCALNNETLDSMHPEVLEALDVHDTFVVI